MKWYFGAVLIFGLISTSLLGPGGMMPPAADDLIPKGEPVILSGYNADADSGAVEDIWEGGAVWDAPSVGQVHNLASTSDEDSAGNTGALRVVVEGLDSTWLQVSESVILDGTNSVATTNKYSIIHKMYVDSAGSAAGNVGTITATASVSDSVTAQINPGINQTNMLIYQIPANRYGYVHSCFASLIRDTLGTGTAEIRLYTKSFGEVWKVEERLGLQSTGSSNFQKQFPMPLRLAPKTLFKMSTVATKNNSEISAGVNLSLHKN